VRARGCAVFAVVYAHAERYTGVQGVPDTKKGGLRARRAVHVLDRLDIHAHVVTKIGRVKYAVIGPERRQRERKQALTGKGRGMSATSTPSG
jgi:hypothetical protein